ncbi:isoleucine--tRNA ligase [Oceaniferula spumae]|uniref:Isoleucine--tRNA ligase n=1 Tax=Oceaniferula spumae TaxID=2979115 RepID=A0AAT9FJ68_9BACT
MSADESNNQPDYKGTLSLPDTSFPMRGDLVKNEPGRLERWNQENLYQRIQKRRKDEGAPRFILHDGPPFANGDVHMGTALNKVLKDLVLKSKTMAGFETPYIPGWDCHGLPIEFKVMQDARDEEPAEIRRRCEEFARGWIDTQKASFRRLGVLGDWENPYLTLDPAYESDIIRTFATMVEKGLVYQSQKPVQWSYGAKTALAEAEVEYQDKKSIAIFVKFNISDTSSVASLPDNTAFAIWTTTPWTLPANLGIAVHERLNYVVGRFTKEDAADQNIIIVRELLEEFQQKTGLTLAEELAEIKGSELEGLEAQHPFLDRKSKVILAPFVTTDTGTGAVHIAPGHGADDYSVGMQNGLAVLSPVDDDGRFTEEVGVPELVGLHVMEKNEGNIGVLRLLAANEALLGKENYAHSYPHCWRSKTPIIFRAVEQFFIRIDDLRKKALTEIDETTWLPAWGRNRIYGTVEARPDWCISRQRTWGVPLPVFFDANEEVILDAEVSRKVADLVEKEGTNIWFELSDAELASRLGLPEGCTKCGDTLDVWIDSGSSHVAVMDRHPELSCPADLYLEATDQHRGWFQSSLMLSVAVRDKAPYKAVLTHGFVVDKDGGKISKSAAKAKGKPTDAAHFYNKYGADIVRLWVSSVDWQTEVPFGEDLFKQIADPYRRLRNTLRILLGNINGFDPATQSVAKDDMTVLDRWVLERLNEVITECKSAYESYQFRKVFNQINQFCANELSALYIDITKDRMYCDGLDSTRRLAAQTVMHRVFDSIVRLMAPILAFTADEAWEHAGNEGSVHEQDFPEVDSEFVPGMAIQQVTGLLEIRAVIQTAIEEQVQAKAFNKNNEADVTLTLPADHTCAELLNDRDFVTEFFILSKLNVINGAEISATAKATDHCMCPRCRRYEPLVTDLCQRCSEVV